MWKTSEYSLAWVEVDGVDQRAAFLDDGRQVAGDKGEFGNSLCLEGGDINTTAWREMAEERQRKTGALVRVLALPQGPEAA